jgi:hypothetical protein
MPYVSMNDQILITLIKNNISMDYLQIYSYLNAL